MRILFTHHKCLLSQVAICNLSKLLSLSYDKIIYANSYREFHLHIRKKFDYIFVEPFESKRQNGSIIGLKTNNIFLLGFKDDYPILDGIIKSNTMIKKINMDNLLVPIKSIDDIVED